MNEQDYFKKILPSPSYRVVTSFLHKVSRDELVNDISESIGMIGKLLSVGHGNKDLFEMSDVIMGNKEQAKSEIADVQEWMHSSTPEEYRRNLAQVKEILEEV